jgi:hypothetical protein
MKRYISVILAILFILTAFSGCGGGNTSGNGTTDATSGTSEAAPTDFTLDTWVSDGHVKVMGEDKKPKDFVTDTTIYMAKNEKEAFNVSFRVNAAVEGIRLVLLEGETGDLEIEIFDEYLISTGRKKHYPDPLVPYTESFSVEENMTKTLMVRFASNENTSSGEHKFKFAAVYGGKTLAEYNVSVNVWDFELPEVFTCESAVGLSRDMIFSFEKASGATTGKVLLAYYEILLEYGLTPYDPPYQITSDKADEYMSDPRVKSIRVDYNLSDEALLKAYEKLKSNPEWIAKAYCYPIDEPLDMDDLNTLVERCERLRTIAPELKIIVPFFVNIQVNATTDQVDLLAQYMDIWCPKAPCWSENGWLADPLKKGYFGDRMDEQKEQGDKIWWYVCWEPGNPYCNLYVNELGLNHVELFWQQYYYGVEGFLYWHANYWQYTNPWESMVTVPHLSSLVYGDGSLLYPGHDVGVDGPIASFRMDCIRNGMEDYDLLLKAEELFGRDWVVEQVKKVSQSLTKHTKDAAVYAAVRKTIGDAIESALNG